MIDKWNYTLGETVIFERAYKTGPHGVKCSINQCSNNNTPIRIDMRHVTSHREESPTANEIQLGFKRREQTFDNPFSGLPYISTEL